MFSSTANYCILAICHSALESFYSLYNEIEVSPERDIWFLRIAWGSTVGLGCRGAAVAVRVIVVPGSRTKTSLRAPVARLARVAGNAPHHVMCFMAYFIICCLVVYVSDLRFYV